MTAAATPPRILVVMGVSGSGKSTVAALLCRRLGWPFQEGDDLHSERNVEKMRAGIPLDDTDRGPWLDACAAWIRARHEAGEPGILTCSALKRSYRTTLSQGLPDVWFLYLKVPERLLQERLANRPHHYMPGSLLPTQLRTLEEPGADEQAIEVEDRDTPEATVAAVLERL